MERRDAKEKGNGALVGNHAADTLASHVIYLYANVVIFVEFQEKDPVVNKFHGVTRK